MCDNCNDDPKFTSAPGTPERRAELAKKTADDILEHGLQVAGIFADGDTPGFYYSIGRSFYDRTEILVTGNLPPEAGSYMVNTIAKLDTDGEIDLLALADSGEPVKLEAFGCEMRFVRADPEAGSMYQAINVAEDGLIDAVQMIWPDDQGRWPEDPDFAYGPDAQPIHALV